MIELFEKIKEKLKNNNKIKELYYNNRIMMINDYYFIYQISLLNENIEIFQINLENNEEYHIFSINSIIFEEREEKLNDIIINFLINLFDY